MKYYRKSFCFSSELISPSRFYLRRNCHLKCYLKGAAFLFHLFRTRVQFNELLAQWASKNYMEINSRGKLLFLLPGTSVYMADI